MAFCTQSNIEDILSAEGVLQSTNDDGDDVIADATKVANAITRAENRIKFKAAKHYTDDELDGNTWVRWAAAYLSAGELCKRRGNGVPVGIQDEVDRILAELEMVFLGQAEIPDATPRNSPEFAMSNLTVSQRSRVRKIRVVAQISAGPQTGHKVRHLDPNPMIDPW